ncbi:MAG: tripartite tricarboxylate transporter TctB family protein [Betaproteobacteria bacterium]|nr:tripartite tricarboxylate transporter TctB family protein [Betaproteobacteria bacterium]
MSDEQEERAAPRVRSAELVVAGLFIFLGAVVIYDSLRLGVQWGDDGPQSGYFPFYLGVLVCASSAVNFFRGIRLRGPYNPVFVETAQLRMVLAVLVPSAIYVALIEWLGIYLSSALFIAFFMRWLGKYAWWKLGLVAVGVAVAFFVIFEMWFKVPLPKGPLEILLGLD